MKIWVGTLFLCMAAPAALAQEDAERKLDELRRQHERAMADLERRFAEEREKLTQEFRRRMADLRPPRPEGERRPEPDRRPEPGRRPEFERRPEGFRPPEPPRFERERAPAPPPGRDLEATVRRLVEQVERLVQEVERLKHDRRGPAPEFLRKREELERKELEERKKHEEKEKKKKKEKEEDEDD